MPYISPADREKLHMGFAPSKVGELNYLFTKEIVNYINVHGVSYTTINEIIGALECAKLEFYRRVAAPYEEDKIHENGDVYPVTRDLRNGKFTWERSDVK